MKKTCQKQKTVPPNNVRAPAKRTREWLRGWQYLYKVSVIDPDLYAAKSFEEIMNDPNVDLARLYFEEMRRDASRDYEEALCKKVYQEKGNLQALFDYIAIAGEKALLKTWVQEAIREWRELLNPDRHVAKEDRKLARDNLLRVGKALTIMSVSGRTKEITEREKEEIIGAWKKWFPVYQKLKEVFNPLWDNPRYWSWGLEDREDAIDRLIKKHSIPVSVKGVQDIEKFPLWKKTPWDMTKKRVSDESGWSKATIEQIYRDHRKENPDLGTKKRKKLTTPVVDERTP